MHPPRYAGHAEYLPLATDANLDLEDTTGTEEDTSRRGRNENRVETPSFDINDTGYDSPPPKSRMANLAAHRIFRPLLLTFAGIFAISIFRLYASGTPVSESVLPVIPTPTPIQSDLWTKNALNFTSTRPEYLSSPPHTPLIIRLAIIARVDAFERRQAIRENVLVGIKQEDVKIHYRFFVARPREEGGDVKGLATRLGLEKEREAYGDVEVIQAFHDVPERISEKRFEALKWTNAVSPDSYDYSMTIDSDTFCRFSALARRLSYTHPDAKPREQPIMIGRMAEHLVYFSNTVSDGNTNDSDEDYFVSGPWYKYPVGIGYMLSSNLTKTILDIDPPVAHHINYPSDDVMIGSWVAALKNYHDVEAIFNTTDKDPPAGRVVHPKPLLPYVLDTEIVDDQVGWHDVRKEQDDGEEQRGKRAIGWESVCIHQMGIAHMKALRAMKEVKDEWDDVVS